MGSVNVQWNKDVEICDTLSEKQKEEQKRRFEVLFKRLESLL